MKKVNPNVSRLIAALTLSFFISCQPETDDFMSKSDETSSELSDVDTFSFEIEDAQNWFEANQSPIVVIKTKDLELRSEGVEKSYDKRPIALQAVWKHAFASIDKDLATVEVELRTQGRFGMASASAMEKYEATGNQGYLTSLSRLLVIRDQKQRTTDSFIMTIMGEPEYLESHNFELYNNTYLKKDADFAGLVFFHDLKGNYVNGWEMEEGKVVAAIEEKVKGGASLSASSGTYSVYTTYTQCTDWYNLGETVTYNGTTCTSTTYYTGSYTSTSTGSYGGNGGAGSYTGGGSGSSSSGSTSLTSSEVFANEEPKETYPFPHCSSFEYYKPPGASVTAAAVEGLSNTFIAPAVVSGKKGYRIVYVGANRMYFTMPAWMQNGRAATLTAQAVNVATDATEAWFVANPKASRTAVSQKWEADLKTAMKAIGGQMSAVAPFSIKNASQFKKNFFSTGNCD